VVVDHLHRVTHLVVEPTPLPWALSFSFGRAIQLSALEIWHGEEAYVVVAQRALRSDRM
jgi:fructose-bisphosphate aldolase class 1